MMKRISLFGAVFLLTLFASSCGNENFSEEDNGKEYSSGVISLKATISDGSARMAYDDGGAGSGLKFAWSDSEKFNLYQGTSSTAAEFTKNAAGNSFTGKVPTGGIGTYYAVYGENINNNNGELYVDISRQTGTTAENGITTFMVAETDDLTNTLSFCHKLAVLKLTLTLPDNATGTVRKVTITGMHNHATYSMADGYSYEDKYKLPIEARNGSAGFTVTGNKTTAYVAVFPEEVAANAVTIKAETSDYCLYYYTIKSAKQLNAGKVVPVTVALTKTAPEYVDLGLPSGTKWAAMNVGAISSADYGDHYEWGDTDTKNNYSFDNSMCNSETNDPLEEYIYPDVKSIAGTIHDVAHVKWGGKWRMPTSTDFHELTDNCTPAWTDNYNSTGIAGLVMTSTLNSKSIFLPAGSFRYGSSISQQGTYGNYWTATPDNNDTGSANIFSFRLQEISTGVFFRWAGFMVRPVYVTKTSSDTTDFEDMTDSNFN